MSVPEFGSVEFIHEDIEITQDGKYIYRKSKGVKKTTLGFYLRFISEHWHPCKECQKDLWETIVNADNWTIGNKDYLQPIELSKRIDQIDDSAWVKIEEREITEKEAKELEKAGVFTWS